MTGGGALAPAPPPQTSRGKAENIRFAGRGRAELKVLSARRRPWLAAVDFRRFPAAERLVSLLKEGANEG
jgi:hypothetical protein